MTQPRRRVSPRFAAFPSRKNRWAVSATQRGWPPDGMHIMAAGAAGRSLMQDWWRGAVMYQVYPRSFQDSDGNGIGDLAGITAGSTISPRWASMPSGSRRSSARPWPTWAMTCRITTDIDPLFGTLAGFDALVSRAHALGLKVIIDQVISHSSAEHPFFKKAAPRAPIPRPTGMSGLTRAPTVRRPTTGSRLRRLGLGVGFAGAGSTTCTISWRASPTSTSTTPMCRTGCCRPCASGSTGASTASGSTR